MKFLFTLFKRKNEYKLEDVFTPTSSADISYISRPDVEKKIEKAIDIPGKQVVIYGHSGSGKTTVLKHIIRQKKFKYIITSCTTSSTLETIIMDAFDLLNPYYVVEKKDSEKYGVSGNLETEYLGIKSSINNSLEIGSEISQKRVLPPQLTEQRLCQFIATANIVWIIEDFHKVSEEEKIKISQMMKLFMDRAVESKNSKIIVLGAAEHGYEVCKFDSELNNRVAEIEVPLLTSTEIGEIITSGCKALNIEMSEKIKKEIAKYANCLATIAHQLAYNICYNKDIKITSKKLVKIEDEELKKAVEDFSSDKQDTYNQLYLDITQHRKATFENARIILDALSQFEGDNIQHHEIFEKIKEKNPSYPQGNLSVYLSKLCSPESYEVLRCNGKLYSFSDPFFKSYIRMKDRNNVN